MTRPEYKAILLLLLGAFERVKETEREFLLKTGGADLTGSELLELLRIEIERTYRDIGGII